MTIKVTLPTLALGVILVNLAGLCNGALQVRFYSGKCGFADVEAIVAGVITAQFFRDPTLVAALLRLQFHDCFANVSLHFLSLFLSRIKKVNTN